jgi:hypothetical protein
MHSLSIEELIGSYIDIVTAKTLMARSGDERDEIKDKYKTILTKKIKEIYEPRTNAERNGYVYS